MTTIQTVLIANRGEIAERIIRTCGARGMRTVVVHSAADAGLPFVQAADSAIELGATTAESYLDGPAIIEAARAAGADAIHPGYGFLAENADFARAVTEAGLLFIGPRAEVIEQLGRKDHAREIAERAGVPVTPHYEPDAVPADAYPVLVKAAFGGGGKGMHVVERPEDLAEALAAAAREARSAFGDDTLLIEKYVRNGRHIEVQVFGDEHGAVVHLFERDCSVQRRHQKIIEEAPATGLNAAVRDRILTAAVALCHEVGYTNAGTVEFLVDGDEAWFLEMNTRLQVEHPVTEEITGLDLVDWQLRVAAGERLPLSQDDITCTGHAIEVRVYAEDPYRDFLPQTGTVRELSWPASARIENGIDAGVTISTAFDPMLAKIITHASTREQATDAMIDALDHTAVLGVVTNIGFVRRLLASDYFAKASIHTAWLDSRPEDVFTAPECPPKVLAAAAQALHRPIRGPLPTDGWRSAGTPEPLHIPVQDPEGQTHRVSPSTDPAVRVHSDGVRVWAAHEGQSWTLSTPDPMGRDALAVEGGPQVHAPMPGLVLMVDVAIGQRVEVGQRLGVMEAMKMELSLTAPVSGTLAHVAVQGSQVGMGQLLFDIQEDADA